MRKAEKKANFSPRPQVGISVCYASSSSSLCKNSLACMMAMALFSDHAGDIDLIETYFIFVSAFAPLASPRFVGPTLEASPFEGVSSGVGALLRPAPCLVGEATSTPIRPPDNWPFGPRFTHSVRWRRRMWLVDHILVIGARPLVGGACRYWSQFDHSFALRCWSRSRFFGGQTEFPSISLPRGGELVGRSAHPAAGGGWKIRLVSRGFKSESGLICL